MNPTIADWRETLKLFGIPFTTRSTGSIYLSCPFHREKTPSFKVWADTARFKCFGCGCIGSFADFLRRHLKISDEITDDAILLEFCKRGRAADESPKQLWLYPPPDSLL